MIVVILTCVFPVMTTEVAAVNSGVQARLELVQNDFPNGSYFTTDGSKNSPHDLLSILEARGLSKIGFDQSTTCVGFAKYVWAKVFGHNITSGYRTNVAGGESNNLRAGLAATWQNAKVGDLVYFYESATDPAMNHAAIIWGINGSTISLVDCNYDHTNQIKYYSVTCGQSGWPLSYCRIFRANNYDKINGTVLADGETTVPVQQTPSVTQITFSNLTTPGNLIAGNGGHINGYIYSSNSPITSVTAEVYNQNGQMKLSASSSGFSVSQYGPIQNSKIDTNLKFGTLPAGTYYIKYTVKAKDGTTATATTGTFTVTSKSESIAKTYTVTFNANGGSVGITSKTVTADASYGSLPTPTRNGYTFDGWYTSSSSGTRITSNSKVSLSGNQTLYAHWAEVVPSTYTVTFDANGGSVSPSSVTLKVGESYKDFPTPVLNGYKFIGWALYQVDPDYKGTTANVLVSDVKVFGFTEDVTLYASWSKIQDASNGGTTQPSTPTYGAWSSWSTTPVTASSTRQVETRTVKVSDAYTQYRYGRYVSNGHDCWCAAYLQKLGYGQGNLDYSGWTTTRYSISGKDWSCGYCNGNHQHVDHTSSNGTDWWTEYKSPNGQSYYWEETQTVPAEYRTEYRYRDLMNP